MSEQSDMESLRDACDVWQSGRDGGSTPIRAAARVLTGTSHYFHAPFISQHEADARKSPQLLARADALLRALDRASVHTSPRWGQETGTGTMWAGRGIRSAPQDAQIRESLSSGSIAMPLWGLSLDRDVALGFSRGFLGPGFLFQLEGAFPGVAAWLMSGAKSEEQELIAGGRYEVFQVSDEPGHTLVRLRFIELLTSRRSSER
ncbi:hypothetical protein LG315_07770 [Microbacterium marinum]|uniref:hypothetical protein n=1 Tax=Microbacterium marinum TaxID=421115 RepID=UPI0038508CD8